MVTPKPKKQAGVYPLNYFIFPKTTLIPILILDPKVTADVHTLLYDLAPLSH